MTVVGRIYFILFYLFIFANESIVTHSRVAENEVSSVTFKHWSVVKTSYNKLI